MAYVEVSKGVSVDSEGFLAHLEDFCKIMGRNMGDVLLDQSGKFCLDMVKYTRPFTGSSPGDGNTTNAQKKGRLNIKNSVYKIFRPIQFATVSQIADLNDFGVFKLWTKRKGEARAGKIARWVNFQKKYRRGNTYGFLPSGSGGTIASFHTSARTDDGHGPLKSMYRQKGAPPIFIVEKENEIKALIRAKEKDVGKLKSAYWFAAQQIGSKERFPSWVQNSAGSRTAIGINQVNAFKMPSVTVGNTIGKRGMRGASENFVQVAINHRAYSMRVLMANKLNKEKTTVWEAYKQGRGLASHRYFR